MFTKRRTAMLARDAMRKEVTCVAPDTPLEDVAKLLREKDVVAVPVVDAAGQVIGLVARDDVLKDPAVEHSRRDQARSLLGESVVGLDRHFEEANVAEHHAGPAPDRPPQPTPAEMSAAAFRHLVVEAGEEAEEQRKEAEHAEKERRQQEIRTRMERRLGEQDWQAMLQRARKAAETGAREYELLRIPCELCSDGGRAVNAGEPIWPETLQGEAADLYRRWEKELKPLGFRLTAQVVDFPGGIPGDIGLSLVWGEAAEQSE